MKHLISILIFLCFITILHSENRTALIIGNSSYSDFPELSKPKMEAQMRSDAFNRLGFEVSTVLDATKEDMDDAIYDFEERLKDRGGLALFHYGGHGIQVAGENYLIPVNADIPDERRVRTRAVNIEEVLLAMDASGSNTNIIIMDACRDNPLPSSSRSAGTRGHAAVRNQPADSIIVYSASAENEAQDGLFTPILLKYIEDPELEFTDLLKKVRSEVRIASGGAQRTGEYNQLESDIYLAGNQVQQKLQEIPDWFINPPHNQWHYYGTAFAKRETLEESLLVSMIHALADISKQTNDDLIVLLHKQLQENNGDEKSMGADSDSISKQIITNTFDNIELKMSSTDYGDANSNLYFKESILKAAITWDDKELIINDYVQISGTEEDENELHYCSSDPEIPFSDSLSILEYFLKESGINITTYFSQDKSVYAMLKSQKPTEEELRKQLMN